MSAHLFLCKGCGRQRPCNPRLPPGVQEYCSWPSCQRKRKARWQQSRLQTDPAYASDQRDADACWHEKVPGYHKNYDANRKKKSRSVGRRCRRRSRRRIDSDRRVVTMSLGDYQLRVSVSRPQEPTGSQPESSDVELALLRVQPAPDRARAMAVASKDGRVSGL